jgi:hypothetical protein
MGANASANGDGVQEGNPQFLQGPAFGAAVTSDGRADCEAGQRGFLYRNAANANKRFHIAVDANNPGAQGPTFAGRARVPAGETFTRRPEVGPSSQLYTSEHGP